MVLLLPNAAGRAAEDEQPRSGTFRLVMTTVELLGEAVANDLSSVFAPDEELSWQVHVPDTFSPERPPGLVVFASPTSRGAPISADWRRLLAEKNLLWIGGNSAGNKIPTVRRMLLATLAPSAINKNYPVNMERCYIAGFSGGAKIAGLVMSAAPEQFTGSIYMGGARFWDDEQSPNIAMINRAYHAFMIGSNDEARRETFPVLRQYQDAGVENTIVIEMPNVGHRLPSGQYLEEAIEYLDSRLQ